MNAPRVKLTEGELDDAVLRNRCKYDFTEYAQDDAIRRNRTGYDCAECTDEWDADDEAAELAELAAEAKAPLRGASKVLAGIILVAVAATAVLIAAALERSP